MTEVGGEDLLIKILLRHAIVAFKVVGRGNPVPDPPCGRILRQILAKFWEFSCHESKQVCCTNGQQTQFVLR